MAKKTTLYDLHTDVLLCIFDYFNVNELYEIFSEVIPYLTSLLLNSRIRLHLRKPICTKIDPGQVISIDLTYLPQISSPSISDFINLRSLILRDMEDPKMLVNQPLSQSLEILHLNISLRNKPDIIPLLIQLLTQLSKLKSYTLSYLSSYFILQKDLLILPTLSTSVEYVKLDVKCSINCLEILLEHLPRLRRLQSTIESNPQNSTITVKDTLFSSINNIFLTWEYIPFEDIITFCKKMPNLKQCTFIANEYRYDDNICNPVIWRQFIEYDHISLKKLVVHMQPRPYYREHTIPRQFRKDPYFRSINFKFEEDYRRDIILAGNYVKST